MKIFPGARLYWMDSSGKILLEPGVLATFQQVFARTWCSNRKQAQESLAAAMRLDHFLSWFLQKQNS